MAMLITPRAIAKMANMDILAIMATTVMVNGNFSMVIRGIQLKSKQNQLSDVKFISIRPLVQKLSIFL